MFEAESLAAAGMPHSHGEGQGARADFGSLDEAVRESAGQHKPIYLLTSPNLSDD